MSNEDDSYTFSRGAAPDITTSALRRDFTSHPDLLAASLVDSDETADNLPGPGRNLGRAYDVLGSRLSRFLEEKLKTLKSRDRVKSENSLALRVASDFAAEDATRPLASSRSRNTDSTASNLPGPGRTVGMFFSWLGKKLERQANMYATRKGGGPEALIFRILRLRFLHDRPLLALSIIQDKKEERDAFSPMRGELSSRQSQTTIIKDHLSSFRSSVLSTQLQALDCITALAVSDTYIRSALNECLEHESFLKKYSYYDSLRDSDILLTKSRRAIVSITENHLAYLVNRMKIRGDYFENRAFTVEEFVPQMTRYLRDPDFFFLAVRFLDRFFHTYIALDGGEDVLPLIPKFIAKNSEFVEWSAVDSCIGHVLRGGDEHEHLSELLLWASPAEKDGFVMDDGTMKILTDLGSSFFSNISKLPLVLDWITLNTQIVELISCFRPQPTAIMIGFSLHSAARIAHICCVLLRKLTSSDELNDHLNAIELNNEREDIRCRIQSTVMRSKAATAFCYALHYGHIVKWLRIPTESAKDGMVDGSMMLVRQAPIESFVVGRLMSACSALVSFLESEDESLRDSAAMFLNFLTSIDRFCSFVVSLALTMAKRSTGPSRLLPSENFTLFRVLTGNQFTLYRVRQPSERNLSNFKCLRKEEFSIHMSQRSLRKAIRQRASRQLDEVPPLRSQELNATEDCLLWLKTTHGVPFAAAGYYPISAGEIQTTNQIEYVACVVHPNADICLSTITDGASVLRYIDHEGHERSSTDFYVLALRYEPDYLAAFYPPIPPEVPESDCTGPFFWKEMIVEQMPSRVASRPRQGRRRRKEKQQTVA
ncbi:hypothetical protein SCHPADRAFT_944905 [Schizopora paradoxa]|uniref:Uncharacterized protein n=1 Tax=Schizopora paradoxa TaxID=27342 RepID=A0A0H2R8Y8_9AGAM|nr:hypothetical protein SCHPADRAFT_944905 [Schizopora paradoxa]